MRYCTKTFLTGAMAMDEQCTSKFARNVGVIGAAAVLAGSLAACGGGGGGSSGATPATTTSQTNGQALLAAYTVPASIAADKVENYGTPFSAGNTYIQANCAVAGEDQRAAHEARERDRRAQSTNSRIREEVDRTRAGRRRDGSPLAARRSWTKPAVL